MLEVSTIFSQGFEKMEVIYDFIVFWCSTALQSDTNGNFLETVVNKRPCTSLNGILIFHLLNNPHTLATIRRAILRQEVLVRHNAPDYYIPLNIHR